MKLHASGEDYLEAILVLQKEKKGMVRSRRCGPAHGSVQAQCVSRGSYLERGRLSHHGRGLLSSA